ncbi:hypothetical protein SGRIM119S_08558 [Streptomyces griseorubiginosus]
MIEEGLQDALGDPESEARLHHWAAVRGLLCGELEEADRHARQAAEVGGTETRVAALATLARVRSRLLGAPLAAEAALEAALALSGGTGGGPESWRLIRMRAILALDSDRVTEAHEQLTLILLAAVGELAGVEDVLATLVALTRVQVRAGHCREALLTADRWREAARGGGRTGGSGAVRGGARGYRGRHRRTSPAARRTGGACFRGRRRPAVPAARAGRTGQAELLRLPGPRPPWRRSNGCGAGQGDVRRPPPLLHWYADLAEALVVLGETDEAGAVVRRLVPWCPLPRPAACLAALERAEGLREAGVGRAGAGERGAAAGRGRAAAPAAAPGRAGAHPDRARCGRTPLAAPEFGARGPRRGPGDGHPDRCRPARLPGPGGAGQGGHRGKGRRDGRARTHPDGGADRRAGRWRGHQQGSRRGAVHQRQDGRGGAVPGLPQDRRPLPHRARARDGRGRSSRPGRP